MVYSVTPTLGIDLDAIYESADIAANNVEVPHKLGQQCWGDNGLLYVFVVAGGTIAASQTDISVNTSTFAATDGSGSYSGPSIEVTVGDYFWASKASV